MHFYITSFFIFEKVSIENFKISLSLTRHLFFPWRITDLVKLKAPSLLTLIRCILCYSEVGIFFKTFFRPFAVLWFVFICLLIFEVLMNVSEDLIVWSSIFFSLYLFLQVRYSNFVSCILTSLFRVTISMTKKYR